MGEAGGAKGREERGGRRVPRQTWQIVSCLPSPKCGAGARGSAAVEAPPPPPNSRGSVELGPPPPQRGKPSPNRFRPDYPLPISFFLFLFFFFLKTHISGFGPQTACCSPSLPRAQLFGAAHPCGCERRRASDVGRRKEEKLVGGVSPAHVNPPPAKPNLPREPSQHWGKFLLSRQPSWIWRRQPRRLWN